MNEMSALLALRIARRARRRAKKQAGLLDCNPNDYEPFDRQEGSCIQPYVRDDPYHGETWRDDI